MLKNLSQLEHIIEGKAFRFICENDAPIHFVKEALFQFQKYIGQVEDYAKAQQAAAPIVEEKKEDQKIEPIQEAAHV
jgi:hypothetical protein